MLTFITEEIREETLNESLPDVTSWRKKMVHYIKEENPEVNAAIIESAEKTGLEPKAIALGAYVAYVMLEKAANEEAGVLDKIME